MVGDFFRVAQFVHQHDADRNLAFELVGRLYADQICDASAPFAIGIIVAGPGFVLKGRHVARGNRLVLYGGIDLLQKCKRDVMR